jgi:hypothetical protein
MLVLGFLVVCLDLLLEKREEEYPFQQRPHWGLPIAVLLLLLTVTFGATDSNAFIYFQF